VNGYRFWWDEQNIEHIADHGVEPYEAEQVIELSPALGLSVRAARANISPLAKHMEAVI
jgi:hypothetical protein